ncbi:MAG: hypothetical protein ABR530_08405 [Pyrinomonadaceae bacterium]
MKRITCRPVICVLCAAVMLLFVSAASAAELTQAQAIARVRSILRNNTAACRINRVNAVTAARVRAGWRVTANIVMSASGRRLSEKATWIVSEKNGASPQDQLTAEIQNGC